VEAVRSNGKEAAPFKSAVKRLDTAPLKLGDGSKVRRSSRVMPRLLV
jgi:hypothetical protein